MRPRIQQIFISTLLLAIAATTATAYEPGTYVPGELIIKFKEDASKAAETGLLAGTGARVVREYRLSGAYHIVLDGISVAEGLSRFSQDPLVAYVEPNLIGTMTSWPDDGAPNDSRYPEQWALENTGLPGSAESPSLAGADISWREAMQITIGDPSVLVAVIDTGTDYTVPDLAPNIFINPAEDPAQGGLAGVDDDNNGYVDDIRGWDFVDHDADVFPPDHVLYTQYAFHGTHVAGTIAAATNNTVGVAGVAPGIRILPLRVIGRGSPSIILSGALDAYEYAADMGAKILNMSYKWSASEPSQAEYETLGRLGDRGVLCVVAAANDYLNLDEEDVYPVEHPLANLIVVAASGPTDELGEDDRGHIFSNYGPSRPNMIAAPGVRILSTYPSHIGIDYHTMSGTSMAAPHVAGAAALLRSLHPELSAAGVKTILLDGSDHVASLVPYVQDGRRLNAAVPLGLSDAVPPAPISGFAVTQVGSDRIDLSWTAPGDDGVAGTASLYDLRYDTSPITAENFAIAPRWPLEPVPGAPGVPDTLRVTGLPFDTTWYFAMNAEDEFGNSSGVVTLEFRTLPAPAIEVSPTAVSLTLTKGEIWHGSVAVLNVGDGVLDYQSRPARAQPSWLLTDAEGEVAAAAPAAQVPVTVMALSQWPGNYTMTFEVVSNDPVNSIVPVTIELLVLPAVEITSSTPTDEQFAFTCPAGDAESVVVTAAFPSFSFPSTVVADRLTLVPPAEAGLTVAGGVITADRDVSVALGEWTTFTLVAVGGCGSGEGSIQLDGNEIGTAHISVRSADFDGSLVVDTSDIAFIASAFGVAEDNSDYDVAACADVVMDSDSGPSRINLSDLVRFSTHNGHSAPGVETPIVFAHPGTAVLGGLAWAETEGSHTAPNFLALDGARGALALELAVEFPSSIGTPRWEHAPGAPGIWLQNTTVVDGVGSLHVTAFFAQGLDRDSVDLGRFVADGSVTKDGEGGIRLVRALLVNAAGELERIANEAVDNNSTGTLPGQVYLGHAHPNPFNPRTTIEFGLPQSAHVAINIYDGRGRLVRVLSDEHYAAGVHDVIWNGDDMSGRPVASGLYFSRLHTAGEEMISRMMLIR